MKKIEAVIDGVALEVLKLKPGSEEKEIAIGSPAFSRAIRRKRRDQDVHN
jgi:hypothetical protein